MATPKISSAAWPAGCGMEQAEMDLEQKQIEQARTHPEAFAGLYDRYGERIYRHCYHRLGNHPDAEDLTAQVFRRALEGLPAYDWRGIPFGAWLFRIAHNLLIDRYRSERTAVSLETLSENGVDLPERDAPAPDARLAQIEEGAVAWAAVARLPMLQRRAVVLRFGRDLSNAEVGKLIGRSEAATKQLIYRAMRSLRTQLATSETPIGSEKP